LRDLQRRREDLPEAAATALATASSWRRPRGVYKQQLAAVTKKRKKQH